MQLFHRAMSVTLMALFDLIVQRISVKASHRIPPS